MHRVPVTCLLIFFQSVYISDDQVNLTNKAAVCCEASNNIGLPVISQEEVINALLSANEGIGNDGVPASILKELASSLAKPLTLIFNNSLTAGIFPAVWRSSHIVPVFKSGKRSDISNYRGITILSAIPKAFEKIVTEHLYFNVKNLISINQHGFCKKRSTVTNLCEFVMYGTETFECRTQLDVIYTDFAKAFDSINHSLLLLKLSNIGLNGSFIKWIHSYLTNRTQYVLLNGFRSKTVFVHSGVPQGSHLGPLLFIIFINDIINVIKNSNYLLYADDLKIYKRINTIQEAQELQDDLNAITKWCTNNALNLNVKKCKTMSYFRIRCPLLYEYGVNGIKLERVSTVKDLGVIFDPSLTFNFHIDAVISKASMLLGFVMRATKNFTNTLALNTLYTSIIRSVLEYGVLIWNPTHSTKSDRIESIQKRYIRYYFRKIGWP